MHRDVILKWSAEGKTILVAENTKKGLLFEGQKSLLKVINCVCWAIVAYEVWYKCYASFQLARPQLGEQWSTSLPSVAYGGATP